MELRNYFDETYLEMRDQKREILNVRKKGCIISGKLGQI